MSVKKFEKYLHIFKESPATTLDTSQNNFPHSFVYSFAQVCHQQDSLFIESSIELPGAKNILDHFMATLGKGASKCEIVQTSYVENQ